jgi:1-acyl-sn-glycerol-3-phosphate acyltransferase
MGLSVWLYRLNRAVGPALGLYWRLGLRGAVETIPSTGPLIVASNHSSFLDPWLLGMVFPRRIRYLITHRWYYRSAVWTAVFRAYGTVPVRAQLPRDTVEAVCRHLARGEVAGIFPEGGVSHDGRLRRLRPGLAWIAARSGAPVIPVRIRGSFASLPRHRTVPRPVRVTVHVGSPLVYPGAGADGPPPFEASQAFQTRVLAALIRLGGPDEPRDGDSAEPAREPGTVGRLDGSRPRDTGPSGEVVSVPAAGRHPEGSR